MSRKTQMFGNRDKEKKHPFDQSLASKVVVRQTRRLKENGREWDEPYSPEIQSYSVSMWQRLNQPINKKGKTRLDDLGITTIVLHDPGDIEAGDKGQTKSEEVEKPKKGGKGKGKSAEKSELEGGDSSTNQPESEEE